jgi:CheY-like chemotaxis protein
LLSWPYYLPLQREAEEMGVLPVNFNFVSGIAAIHSQTDRSQVNSYRETLENLRDCLYVVAQTESADSLPRSFILARILIVDDRESMRGALKTFVALNPDWTVCGEAADATEATAKATELRPDLIIMDYKMPGSDGLVAADGIFRVLPDIPIVMLTLFKTSELEQAANLMGIRYVVGKEEGVPTLLSAIENELSRSAPQLAGGPS